MARAASVPEPTSFSGYEIDETKDRLVMARGKASAASDLIGGAGILVVGLAALAGLAWLFGGSLFERGHRGMLFVMLFGLVGVGTGFARSSAHGASTSTGRSSSSTARPTPSPVWA